MIPCSSPVSGTKHMNRPKSVSWAGRIALIEPAPKPARYARYLAPHWKGMARLDSDNGIGALPAALLLLLAAALLFGAGGAGAALAVRAACGQPQLLEFWLAFDTAAALILAGSYWLVSRYGLRFYDTEPADNEIWRLVTVANTAWRALPRSHRRIHQPRLRAANTAARLLLTDHGDTRTRQVLAAHTELLRHLSITVLPDTQSHGQADEALTAVLAHDADACQILDATTPVPPTSLPSLTAASA
ncbi:hypothetical protein Scani_36170 [Streptomyces caniferus]|uniref:Uncharacterized protein n=2 Tax=Streptomyces caniferus TaxID=285557 RepID=A0A640S7Z2_9ACTN|nr:hypothetical protein Scani_36170 [Streptomyces caniferus]